MDRRSISDKASRAGRAAAAPRGSRAGLWVGLGGALLVAGLIWFALPRSGGGAGAAAPSGQVAVAAGRAPALQVRDLQGQTVTLAGKPTVLYFMAAWCSSCTYGESQLRQVQAQLGNSVNVVSVDADPMHNSPAAVAAFASRYGGSWPHVLDEGQRLVSAFRIQALDTTIILDRQGNIVHVGG